MAGPEVSDALIIGGGFAGLAAAASLMRQLHTAIVFDSESYRNAPSNHLHLVPTWDYQDPKRFRAAARADLEKYETIQFHSAEIKRIAKDAAGWFEATDSTGRGWRGRKVILASGVDEIFPDIAGYAACWGRQIFHCLFCHGYEQRDAPSAGVLAVDLLASVKMALHMARMAARLADTVTIYTHGDEDLAAQLRSALKGLERYRVDPRAIAQLACGSGQGQAIEIAFTDRSSAAQESFLAHSPRTRVKGPFADQLSLELTPMGDYVVQPPFNATRVDGVYAAGDSANMLKVATNAIASGSITGAGVSAKLQEEDMGSLPVS